MMMGTAATDDPHLEAVLELRKVEPAQKAVLNFMSTLVIEQWRACIARRRTQGKPLSTGDEVLMNAAAWSAEVMTGDMPLPEIAQPIAHAIEQSIGEAG